MRYERRDLPLGIRLVAQKAHKTEPVLTPEQIGEPFLFGGNLIHRGRHLLVKFITFPSEPKRALFAKL